MSPFKIELSERKKSVSLNKAQTNFFSENFEDENVTRVPKLPHFPGNEWLVLTSKLHMPCLCLANVLPLLQKTYLGQNS